MAKTVKKGAKSAAKGTKRGKREGPSRRSQQRLIALRMGLAGPIDKEGLRKACEKKGCYNAPNFSMDMKKDAVYFNPIEKGGKVTGWKLTPTGKTVAKKVEEKIGNKGSGKKSAEKPAEKASGKAKKAKATKAAEEPKAEGKPAETAPEPAVAGV